MGCQPFVALVVVASLVPCVGCDKSTAPAPSNSKPNLVVVFDSGRGTGQYDQMTYSKYESEVSIVPQANMAVRSIRPQMWYCNGSCGYLAFIRGEHYEFIASQAGFVDGTGAATPTFSDRFLDTPVELVAGKTYLIVMEVWTTKSVGIYTTGARTSGVVGSAEYSTHYGRSDTADHLDRGAIAFQLLN